MILLKYALIFSIIYLMLDFITPYDDSDDADNGVRSGLSIYTDNLTGCQYLKAGIFSQTIPRLDSKGNQICKNRI